MIEDEDENFTAVNNISNPANPINVATRTATLQQLKSNDTISITGTEMLWISFWFIVFIAIAIWFARRN